MNAIAYTDTLDTGALRLATLLHAIGAPVTRGYLAAKLRVAPEVADAWADSAALRRWVFPIGRGTLAPLRPPPSAKANIEMDLALAERELRLVRHPMTAAQLALRLGLPLQRLQAACELGSDCGSLAYAEGRWARV
jgi:hypothetical protein